jgi:hypothetical protein
MPALLVTERLFNVARPEVLRVDKEVFPLTPNVPAIEVLPLLSTVNLLVLILSPLVTPNIPVTNVLPDDASTVNLPELTLTFPEIATLEREVFPVTPNVPVIAVLPPTFKLLVPVRYVLPFKDTFPVPVEKVAVPVCAKLPAVVKLPVLSILNASTFPDVTTNALPVELLVKLNAFPVPAFVKLNDVALPDERLNAMFLPVAVVIVLPPAYADCNVTVLAEHLVTLFDESKHRAIPASVGVFYPVRVR